MHLSTLNRRLSRIEQHRVTLAASCPACGAGSGPCGLRFVIDPDLPASIPPCARCGRVPEPLTFLVTLADDPRRAARTA